MGAPGDDRLLVGIVVGIVVFGGQSAKTRGGVAAVLGIQGQGIVLGVTHDEELSAADGGHDVNPCLFRGGKNAQIGDRLDLLALDLGVAGMRNLKDSVKTAQ